MAQSTPVTVDTIGGGVRVECGPAYGFVSGNTYQTAQFNAPYACALDTNGNLWIADKNNSALEQVSQAGNKTASITTQLYATNGTHGHIVTNYHSFTNITGVAVDPANNLYIMLPSPPEVYQCQPSAEVTSLNVLSTLFLANATASATAMAVDGRSNVFLAFSDGSILRVQMLDSNPPPTIYLEDYAEGISPAVHYVVNKFNWQPSGLAILANGELAVSDTLSNAIYVVSTNDIASNSGPHLMTGGRGAGFDDGSPAFAQFNQPSGLAASADGSLIVCDTFNNRVRAIDTSSNTTTLYGTSSNVWTTTCCACDPTLYAGWVDGTAGVTSNSASGRLPSGVAISPGGSLFVTELYYSLIRQVTNTTFLPVNLDASTPVAATQPATDVTLSSATLNGTVNGGDTMASYYFEWGTNITYGNFTATNSVSNNLNVAQAVSATLSDLSPGTTYHYQLVAFNALGSSYGGDFTVVTPAEAPSVTTLPATSVTLSNATLNANVDPNSSPTSVYFQWGLTTNFGNTTPVINLTNNLTGNQAVSWTINNLLPNTNYWFQVVGVNSGGLSQGSPLVFSTVPQSNISTTNAVGFPLPLFGGPGGHVYVPVVVDLTTNVTLQSLQFRVEVTPNGSAPMIPSLGLRLLTPDDFVPMSGPAPNNAPVSFNTFSYTTSSNGQGLLISTDGSSSGLNMSGSGVLVLLHFAIPSTATLGQSYSLNTLAPSGTSDGQQGELAMTTLPIQTLTITDPAYLAGSSSPSTGYNAGLFGDGTLDNADVNNAIYASAGIRVPPSDSDIFNAMDVYPPDSAGHGGDGFIKLQDWETILGRSVGLAIYPGMDTNNYERFWATGDVNFPTHEVVYWGPGSPPVQLSLDAGTPLDGSGPHKLGLTNSPPGLVWFCQASVSSDTIINASAGSTYELPVYANVLPGFSLAALQFRAIVTGSSGAPALSSIQFNSAAGVTAPSVLPGLSGNDKVYYWPFGSFSEPLQNSNFLGTISVTVPPGAGTGASYALHFSFVDGAPDSSTEYSFESHPGYIWVASSAQQPASITSDEWKIAFFGDLTNSQAADNVDADGDGAPNWQEYLAGTNPTNALSCLKFSNSTLSTNGPAINWLTAPGKTYVLQSSAALNGARWSSINTNSGDGNEYQFVITNAGSAPRFYQILLQP
jgi:sugar lactone lactonase YvrE